MDKRHKKPWVNLLTLSITLLGAIPTYSQKNHASDQLLDWREKNPTKYPARNEHGCPNPSLTASLSVGPWGPLLMQDSNFIDHLAHFDRERIPERVVHAKGGGAFGYFEVTHDITRYTKASIFSKVGLKTPIAMRFSTVGGESGSADTARDPRGFATKFYTPDGNYDLVGNNIPIFFIRDPILFPSFIHTQKRNPQTHLKDKNMFWDFISLRPETTHQVTFLFSDRGIPDGFRHMHGYGSHTFKWVNARGEAVYIKYHMKTDQGIRNIFAENATLMAGHSPDHSIEDLYNAIENGNFPSWTMYVQIMTFEQAEKYKYNPFDLTKVWLHGDFPLIPVGRLLLNRNPTNYFAEIEQLAFTPANMIPGIEPSPDKMLQGRLFSYGDTHRHRLGTNYPQIPVNRPRIRPLKHYERDGFMNVDRHIGGAPNYFPNSFGGPAIDRDGAETVFPLSGDAQRKDTGAEDNFSQTDLFWKKVLTPEEKQRLVDNMADHMKDATEEVRERAISNFESANKEYGTMLRASIRKVLGRKGRKNFVNLNLNLKV